MTVLYGIDHVAITANIQPGTGKGREGILQ
jgi:hypothetical protein